MIQLFKLKTESCIRLIRAVSFHSLVPGDSRERCLDLNSHEFIKEFLQKTLLNFYNTIHVNKGHFEVYLSKFRLSVRTQVFISETFNYLHISVSSPYHEKLLKKLRRLRQCIERSRIYSARYNVVPCTFRCRLNKHRGFHLGKPTAVKIIPDQLSHLMAESKVTLHLAFS